MYKMQRVYRRPKRNRTNNMPTLRIQNISKSQAKRRSKKSIGKIVDKKFLIKLFILSVIFIWFKENHSILFKLQEITYNAVCFLLEICGIEIKKQGVFIIARDLITQISIDCTGFFGIFLLISFILLSNKKIGAKVKGILVLSPLVYIVNILRISVIMLIGYYLGSEYLPMVHFILWDLLYLAVIFLSCLLFFKVF